MTTTTQVVEPLWFDPVITFSAVILGGLITYATTAAFARRTKKRKDQALAYSVIIKAADMCDDLVQLNNISRNVSETRARELAGNREFWQLMPLIFGWDRDLEFTLDELALIAATGNSEVVTALKEMEKSHRLYTSAANRMSDLMLDQSKAEGDRSVEGNVITTAMTPEQYAKAFPAIMQLKELGDKIAFELPSSLEKALETAEQLGPLLKKHYRFKHMNRVSWDRNEVWGDEEA